MDAGPAKDGYPSGSTPPGSVTVRIPAAPLSPWLRLAERFDYAGLHRTDRRRVRRITDWMLQVQVGGSSWLWWEPLGGCIAQPSGSVALVPPGTTHALGELGIAYAIHFDLHADPAVEPLAMLQPGERFITASPPLCPPQSSPLLTLRWPGRDPGLVLPLMTQRAAAPAQWTARCERLSALYRGGGHRGLAARLEAAELLGWALRTLAAGAASPPPPGSPAARIHDLLAEVERRGLARPWTIAGLARHAQMGRSAFCQVFTATTGQAPRAWLEGQRLRLAAHRLQESALPVRRIAAEVGYADPFHFSRAFSRVMGASPRAWRQRWRGGPA